jgi:hypothetical protein
VGYDLETYSFGWRTRPRGYLRWQRQWSMHLNLRWRCRSHGLGVPRRCSPNAPFAKLEMLTAEPQRRPAAVLGSPIGPG